MTVTQEQFYEQHKDADGTLSPELTAQMIDLPVQGDTPAQAAGSSDEPAVAAEADKAVEKVAEPAAEPKPDAPAGDAKADKTAAPVVLAKDGVHTIPYEELVTAREQAKTAKHWEQVAAEQAAQLEALKKAPAPAAEEPKQAEPKTAGVDLGDYSDEAIAKGIEKAVSERVAEAIAPLKAELDATKAEAQSHKLTKHFTTIYEAHPDADSIAESAELQTWIKAQPTFAQAGFQAVLSSGTAAEVVEMFTAFKAATVKPAAPATAPAEPDAAAKAAAVIATAKAPRPMSLSDIPAGNAAHHDEAAAVLEMSPTALLAKFESMAPGKVDELLSRVL